MVHACLQRMHERIPAQLILNKDICSHASIANQVHQHGPVVLPRSQHAGSAPIGVPGLPHGSRLCLYVTPQSILQELSHEEISSSFLGGQKITAMHVCRTATRYAHH